jgi:hypothetical protein
METRANRAGKSLPFKMTAYHKFSLCIFPKKVTIYTKFFEENKLVFHGPKASHAFHLTGIHKLVLASADGYDDCQCSCQWCLVICNSLIC